jgi:hypothetical protein
VSEVDEGEGNTNSKLASEFAGRLDHESKELEKDLIM